MSKRTVQQKKARQSEQKAFRQPEPKSVSYANQPQAEYPLLNAPPFGHDFSQISVLPASTPMVQTKLTVNEPGDRFEQEADWVAEKVMRMGESGTQSFPSVDAEESIQRKAVSAETTMMSSGLEATIDGMRGGGQPLDHATRDFMEPRFGHNFADVRVHTNDRAVESSRAVNALAFTVGHDIAFGADQYQPNNDGGRRLLAHELTHVVQQTGGIATKGIQRTEIQRKSVKEDLNEAMDGWGTDEAAIMSAIARATDAEKQEILNDAALVQRLASELSRGEMLQVLASLKAPLKQRLNVAMDGWGTDEAAIQELFVAASQADRNNILADEPMLRRLASELSLNDMLTILAAASVAPRKKVELALKYWSADISDIRPIISASDDAQRREIWSDAAFMTEAHDLLGEQDYLTFVVALGMVQPGATPEDGATHTSATDADAAIQTHLATYVQDAVKDGRQISGMVAVVSGDDWDRAGIAHYSRATWENGKRDEINGFVDGEKRVWIHKDRGNAGTMIHEAVHKYSTDDLLGISQPLNEGVTEYFARKVCAALTPPITGRGNYQSNHDCTVALVGLVSETTVASAFFDGAISSLRDAFITKKSEADWTSFVDHTKSGNWADAAALTTP